MIEKYFLLFEMEIDTHVNEIEDVRLDTNIPLDVLPEYVQGILEEVRLLKQKEEIKKDKTVTFDECFDVNKKKEPLLGEESKKILSEALLKGLN